MRDITTVTYSLIIIVSILLLGVINHKLQPSFNKLDLILSVERTISFRLATSIHHQHNAIRTGIEIHSLSSMDIIFYFTCSPILTLPENQTDDEENVCTDPLSDCSEANDTYHTEGSHMIFKFVIKIMDESWRRLKRPNLVIPNWQDMKSRTSSH